MDKARLRQDCTTACITASFIGVLSALIAGEFVALAVGGLVQVAAATVLAWTYRGK